jgi:hypothetical protein
LALSINRNLVDVSHPGMFFSFFFLFLQLLFNDLNDALRFANFWENESFLRLFIQVSFKRKRTIFLNQFLISGMIVFGIAFVIAIVVNCNGVVNFGTAGIDEKI